LVHGVARAAEGVYDTAALLARICTSVAESFAFDRVAITRYDEDARALEPAALEAPPAAVDRWPLALRALEARELVVEGSEGWTAFVAPLLSQGRCLGFLSAERRGKLFSPDADARDAVTTIAVLTASYLERSLAHDELVRLGQLKSNFIALASHELRTPAAVVHGIVSTLHARGAELDDDQLDQLRAALYEQSVRMKTLVDQLLDLSRLDVEAVEIRPQPIDVRERIDSIVSGLAGGSAITVDSPQELEIDADPVAFDRVLTNLLVNALRHGAPPIVVSATRTDRHARIAVEDRGAGVPQEFRGRLFEQFTRSSAAMGRPGSGLGLAIARSYAQAHGGELLYEDARPKGARFEFVLPVRSN
jgi:signal transduction histidine kinase